MGGGAGPASPVPLGLPISRCRLFVWVAGRRQQAPCDRPGSRGNPRMRTKSRASQAVAAGKSRGGGGKPRARGAGGRDTAERGQGSGTGRRCLPKETVGHHPGAQPSPTQAPVKLKLQRKGVWLLTNCRWFFFFSNTTVLVTSEKKPHSCDLLGYL